MKSLTDELREYRLSDDQIARIMRTLDRGQTVRQTYSRQIGSIFINDDNRAELEIIDDNGNTDAVEREWK